MMGIRELIFTFKIMTIHRDCNMGIRFHRKENADDPSFPAAVAGHA